MENIIEVIKTRRNIKEFTDQPVSQSQIAELLDSAIWAPNHRNTEPWRFVVVKKESDVRTQIGEGMI